MPNSKSISVDLTNQVAARGPLTRFMKWYVAGRAGDTVKSGRKVWLVWLQPCCFLVYLLCGTGTASDSVEADVG